MIKLVDLLLENDQKPKAIFLAGPAGSGKSTFVRNFLQNKGLKSINVDDSYEELLRQAGLDKPQSGFTADELSQAAKMMGRAQKATREKFAKAMEDAESVIIDGTGAAFNPVKKKKEALEDLGYDTMMVMLYVSPITSLMRNKERGDAGGRSLRPSIIMRTWDDVNKNIPAYQQMFGNDFIIKNNDPEDANKQYDQEEINKYFDVVSYSPTVDDPKKAEKKAKEAEDREKRIKTALNNLPNFDSDSSITSKINSFLS